jgi:hypothetical protein
LGERAFHRWRGREKETIAAAKATLTEGVQNFV